MAGETRLEALERMQRGEATITETVVSVTTTVRDLVESGRYSQDNRYAIAFGALLSHVPDEVKAELVELVRHGRLPEADGLPAGILGGPPFTAPEDPEYRYGA